MRVECKFPTFHRLHLWRFWAVQSKSDVKNRLCFFQIDYPNEKLFKPYQRKSYSMQDLENLLALDADEVKFKEITDEYHLPEVCLIFAFVVDLD